VSHKTNAINNFLILLAIAKAEWRMQVRHRSFWLLVLSTIALALADALKGDRFPSATPLAQSFDLGVDFLPQVLILAAVFVCAPIFFRDADPALGDLLWSLPLSSGQYLAGKFLAALSVTLGLLVGLEAVTWTAVRVGPGIPFYAPLLQHLAVRLGLLLPTLALVVAVNLFLAVLLGRLSLFLLAAALLWLGWTGFLFPPSLLQPGNFLPAGVFYSAILGLGPDQTPLLANRLLWSGVACLALLASVFLYAWRERRARWSTHAPWRLGLIGLAGMGLALGGWLVLDHSAASLQADPLPAQLLALNVPANSLASRRGNVQPGPTVGQPSSGWRALDVRDLAVEVSLIPASGHLAGEATLNLHYRGQAALEKLPLILNRGLQVERVLDLDTGQEVAFTRTGAELLLRPRPSLASGAVWTIKIIYAGRYKTPRVAYRDQDPCLHRVVEARSHVGQDVAFLTRDGDWYPWPLSFSTRREATGLLTVQLPAGRQTFHTGREVADGKLIWEGRWPAPLVASYTPDKLQRLDVAGGHAYLADPGDVVAREEALDYAAAYAGMSRWLEEKASSVTLVQVPLILQPLAASTASGQDVLFIPEGTSFVNRQRDGWTGARVKGDAADRRRTRSREAIAAWWSARLDFSAPYYVTVCPFANVDCSTDPGCTLQTLPQDLCLDLLSSLSAGAWLSRTGQATHPVDEIALLGRVLGPTPSTFSSREEMEQTWTLAHEAGRELTQRGLLSTLAISYDMIEASPACLDLLQAWAEPGDEALGLALRTWLDGHRGGRADLSDLIKRLRR
jgi:ABC-type transport system involved in multi-copper enzyme maturation permease subunit